MKPIHDRRAFLASRERDLEKASRLECNRDKKGAIEAQLREVQDQLKRHSLLVGTPAPTYMEVPLREVREAKRLGARHDDRLGKWFIPAHRPLQPFLKWLPKLH